MCSQVTNSSAEQPDIRCKYKPQVCRQTHARLPDASRASSTLQRFTSSHIGEVALLQQDWCAVLLGSSQALSHAAPARARKERQMWLHMPQTLCPVKQARARHHLSAPAMGRASQGSLICEMSRVATA